MFRTGNFDENFGKKMSNITYAQTYFTTLIEDKDEPMTIEDALRLAIKRMGTSDFAALVDESKQTIDKFLKGVRNPKPEKIDRYLRAFGLKLVQTVAPAKKKKVA